MLSFSFGAGGAMFLLKRVKSDVNGLGKLVREEGKENRERFERLEMALLLVSKNDPERRKIAEFLDGRRNT